MQLCRTATLSPRMVGGLSWAVKKLVLWSIHSCTTFHPEGISDSTICDPFRIMGRVSRDPGGVASLTTGYYL